MTNGVERVAYAGFWIRLWASVIDSVLACMIILPILFRVYGRDYLDATSFIQGPTDFLLNWVFPALATVLFWTYRQATPGKLAIRARVVDAQTGQKPSTGQLIGRYFGYYLSTIPFLLGFFWVAFDERKQGWHDKLAGTVVVRVVGAGYQPVTFDETTDERKQHIA